MSEHTSNRANGKSAAGVLRPQRHSLSARPRLTTNDEGFGIENRTQRAKFEMRDDRGRQIPARQIDQQRCDQWSMHDQAGVAFDFTGVTAVVVDAVSVERKRG